MNGGFEGQYLDDVGNPSFPLCCRDEYCNLKIRYRIDLNIRAICVVIKEKNAKKYGRALLEPNNKAVLNKGETSQNRCLSPGLLDGTCRHGY